MEPGIVRLDLDQIALWPAQGCQVAAKDTAGINAEHIIALANVRLGDMAVHDGRLARIITRPVTPDRQVVMVTLAGDLSIHGKCTHATGVLANHVGGDADMGEDQRPLIQEQEMRQRVDKV
mgnify:CR=1 FL=1